MLVARKGKRTSPPLTREIAARIKRLWKETELNQHQIAAALSLNQGRVSEVLNGQRFPDVQAEA